MPDRTAASNLIQQTLDLLETFSTFNRKAAMRCHIVGLQGEKRRMRYLSRKALMYSEKIQHCAYDVFNPGLEVYPNLGSTDTSSMTNYQSTMRKIIDTLWTIHDKAHGIANDMVMAKLRKFSCPLFDLCECIMDIIGEMERNYRSYEASGWDWHHISRHQESDCNVHDKYEGKEESQGYSDHK